MGWRRKPSDPSDPAGQVRQDDPKMVFEMLSMLWEYFQQAGRLKCFMHLYAVKTCKNHPEIMVKSWLYEGGRMVPEV